MEVEVYDLCSDTGGWVKRVVNLSSYAGQSVTIQIRAESDGSLISNLFIDHVAFQARNFGANELPKRLSISMPPSSSRM